MLKIKTWRDPYQDGFNTISPKEIELQEGLTVLVGCNGAGKSTLLLNIKEEAKNQNIPFYFYDNLKKGGSNAITNAFSNEDYNVACSLWTASEGEAIKINFGVITKLFKNFIENGFVNDEEYRWKRLFKDKDIEEKVTCNQRILLFDAVDSGLSVDSIIELKEVFDLIIEDSKKLNKEVYLIIAANEYELARKSNCFDVNSGKYINFNDYEDYRKFIINSRKKKEKRIDKQLSWRERQKEKESNGYDKLKVSCDKKIEKIKQKTIDNNRELTHSEKWKIDDIERELDDYLRHCKYFKKNDMES